MTDRERVLALIAETVHVRFALDAGSFADRLLELSGGPMLERLSLDDLYLSTACSLGDESAWAECSTKHYSFMREFARRFLREPAASDLAAQVLADLWERRKMARYEGRSTLRTWLGAVVAHAALNAVKTSRPAVTLEGEEHRAWQQRSAHGSGIETTGGESRSLLAQLVAEAIDGLPAGERLLLLLYYEQGLTLDEMGVALRASKAVLSRRLKATRAALRASIESLARLRAGASADVLRAGIDLGRLDLDLGALLGRSRAMEKKAGGAVQGPE